MYDHDGDRLEAAYIYIYTYTFTSSRFLNMVWLSIILRCAALNFLGWWDKRSKAHGVVAVVVVAVLLVVALI